MSIEIKLLTPPLLMHQPLKTRNGIARQLLNGFARSKLVLKGINQTFKMTQRTSKTSQK